MLLKVPTERILDDSVKWSDYVTLKRRFLTGLKFNCLV
jgi:hypothetical protein